MGNLKVNFGGLQAASTDIASGATQLEQILADMDRSLQPLRANWTGSAAESYEASKIKWTQAISDMKALLTDIGRAVGTSGEDYQATDRSNAQRW